MIDGTGLSHQNDSGILSTQKHLGCSTLLSLRSVSSVFQPLTCISKFY